VNVLVAYAHPCPESFVAGVRDRAIRALLADGHQVHLADLYVSSYAPGRPLTPDDRYAAQNAESLVLIHPTWWTSQPAILLGWLDQAVATGLPSVRSIVSVTTHGGPRLANRIGGESGARVISRAVRQRCAQRPPHRRLAIYGLDRSSAAQRDAFLARVTQQIGTLVR
jgi:putative NADPH-quinone reductase